MPRPKLLDDAAALEVQIRETVAASREAMMRAHERADAAAERARRLRGELRTRGTASGARDGEQTLGLLRLATAESARSIRENERFLAIVSHELRQPLTAALAASSLLDEHRAPAVTERA